jgi:hypothetical protein
VNRLHSDDTCSLEGVALSSLTLLPWLFNPRKESVYEPPFAPPAGCIDSSSAKRKIIICWNYGKNKTHSAMSEVRHAHVVAVQHFKVDKSNNHTGKSNPNHSSLCSSIPPTRSTRDLNIDNISSDYQNETKFNSIRIDAVTEKDFSQENFQERMSNYTSSMGNDGRRHRRPRDQDSDDIVQLLALQVYHLPGYSWWQDWWQYMSNNHPVLGVCFHYKMHPIGAKTRIVALIGTVLFGLALTNLFYLFYLWNPEFNRVVATVVTKSGATITLTTGMLLLWTLGSGIHCALNLAMWHIAACACCRNGGCCEAYACCPSLGKHMLRIFVLGILSLCIMIVLLRVAINEQKQDYESTKGIDIRIDDQINLDIHSASEFSFVAGYLVEMVLSLFIYYPIGGTMLFSGVMVCFYKIPILGGRPYEVHLEEMRRNKQRGGECVLRSNARHGSDMEQDSKESIDVNFA